MSKRQSRIEETESGLAVVKEEDPDSVVANKIVSYLRSHSKEHTVAQISEAIGASGTQVVRVLDSYMPDRGGPKFVGEGCGGNWLPKGMITRGGE